MGRDTGEGDAVWEVSVERVKFSSVGSEKVLVPPGLRV